MKRLWNLVVGAAAVAFGLVAYVALSLPDVSVLRHTNPTTTAFTELRARQARERGESARAVDRHRITRWVEYGRISPHLTRAVLVAEDSAFWQHAGVDFDQIRESIEINLERREFARGASTITQQLAKNLYLSPSKNPVRKLKELMIARRLEATLTKRRIFELYLNVIEWGDGVYGAEAAARTYFHCPAAALDREQAATLAAAIINPRLLNPARPSARLLRRRRLILARMGLANPPPLRATGPEPPAAWTPTIVAPPVAEPVPPASPPSIGQPVPLEPPPLVKKEGVGLEL